MKITIRNKLILCFSMLIVLTVVSQFIFNVFFADALYSSYKEDYMQSAFEEISASYQGDVESISELVKEIEDSQNIQLMITSIESGIIYLSTNESVEDLMPTEEEQLDMQMENLEDENLGALGLNAKREPQSSGTPLPTVSEETIELAGIFTYGEEDIYVRMTLPIASIESSVAFFTNSSAVIGAIVLLLGILLSIYVSRSITKPIEAIEKVSLNLANLDFTECASEEEGTKEIVSLAHSINRMSTELQEQIQELNALNERLQQDVDYQRQMEQMRREFVANVSHEMKTPLAILQFYCENLKSNIEGMDKEYYYDTIIEETQRMDEMVKSMLQISSLENGLAKMEMQEMDFSKITKHTVEKLQPLLAEYEVEVSIVAGLTINGDARYIEQAIKNYITNAVSHTSEGGKIRVSLFEKNGYGHLTVYNQGKMIEESHIKRLWESFYKSDQSRVRVDNRNVGLGLYIVKCIIENHMGKYSVDNKIDGVEFRFEIPLI